MARLAELFGREPSASPEALDVPDAGLFVYVKIPEDIGPVDRGDKYEDPLDQLLKTRALGEITGGGSQLGEKRPDGTQGIEFCGIDVQATLLEPTLALLRDALPGLGAPIGTELHYTRTGAKVKDAFGAAGWVIAQPREMLHPGFGF
jgi:hypothetical protein